MNHVKTSALKPPSWRSEARETMSLGGHLILGQLALVSLPTMDLVMLAGLGPQVLGAVGLVNSIATLLLLFCFGVLQAVAPLAGAALGSKHPATAKLVVRNAFLIATAIALLAALVLLLLPSTLALTGQPAELVKNVARYTPTLAFAMLPAAWLTVMRVALPVFGRSSILSASLVIGAAFHAVANYLLIHGTVGITALGLEGVGLSYLLTYVLMLACMVAGYLHGGAGDRTIELDFFRWFSSPLLGRLLTIGLPIGAVLFVEYSLFSGSTLLMGRYGTTALAAHAVTLQWVAIVFIVPLGLSHTALTRLSLAVGRRDKAGLSQSIRMILAATLLFHLVAGAAFLTAPEQLVGMLLDAAQEDTAAVIEAALPMMQVAALLQGLNGLVVVLAAVMRACRDTRAPMLQVLLGYWIVGLGSAALFGQYAGPIGIWLGMTLGFMLTVVGLCFRTRQRLSHLDDLFLQLEVDDAQHI